MIIWNEKGDKCHIECDGCHCKVDNNVYNTISEAELWLPQRNWLLVWNSDREHYCSNCYEQGKERNRPYRVLSQNVIIKKIK